MPKYDYRCTGDCGRMDEVTHGMEEKPEVCCPTCGAEMVRVFNPTSITYKGNGFYTTDYKHVIRSHSDVM